MSTRTLSRRDARFVTQILMDHLILNYYMHKLDLSRTSDCRKCMKGEETSFHVLSQCLALAGLQLRLLELKQVRKLSVRELFFYWKRVTPV